MIKWDLSQGYKDDSTLQINVTHHINKMKDKNHMIMPVRAEKAFEKIQHPFMMKDTQWIGYIGNILLFSL